MQDAVVIAQRPTRAAQDFPATRLQSRQAGDAKHKFFPVAQLAQSTFQDVVVGVSEIQPSSVVVEKKVAVSSPLVAFSPQVAVH